MSNLLHARFFLYLLFCTSLLDVFPDSSWSLDKTNTPAPPIAAKPTPVSTPVAATKPAMPPSNEQLFEQGKFQDVEDRLSPQIDKLDEKQLILLGRAQSGLKNSLAAIKTFSVVLSKNPKSAEGKMYIGNELYLQGKDREAMINFREALDLNPKLEAAYLMVEKLYIKKNNKYELRMLYSDMVDRLGEKPEYITRLCELNTQSGIYDLSKSYCKRGIALQKSNAKNYIFLAQSLKETGDLEEAKKLLKKTADEFSNSAEAQIGYAQFLDEQKNFIDSSAYYKKATLADPKSSKAWVGFAMSSLEIEKYQDTLNSLTIACDLDRRTSTQVRRAITSLKILKQLEWYDKFEALAETCGLPNHDSSSKN